MSEIVNNQATDLSSKKEWLLETDGTNLIDILGNEYVDSTRTISNDIIEVYELLGIEASRSLLINQLDEVFIAQGLMPHSPSPRYGMPIMKGIINAFNPEYLLSGVDPISIATVIFCILINHFFNNKYTIALSLIIFLEGLSAIFLSNKLPWYFGFFLIIISSYYLYPILISNDKQILKLIFNFRLRKRNNKFSFKTFLF